MLNDKRIDIDHVLTDCSRNFHTHIAKLSKSSLPVWFQKMSIFILFLHRHHYYAPTSVGRRHYEMIIMKWWVVSIRSSVCRVLQPNPKTERPKTGRMEAHHIGNLWTYLEVKRSNVKITRPINVVTDNAPCRSGHQNFLKISLLRVAVVTVNAA